MSVDRVRELENKVRALSLKYESLKSRYMLMRRILSDDEIWITGVDLIMALRQIGVPDDLVWKLDKVDRELLSRLFKVLDKLLRE